MEREVEKVNPEVECERNSGNGRVFLWPEREKERQRVGRGGGLGREGDPFPHSYAANQQM